MHATDRKHKLQVQWIMIEHTHMRQCQEVMGIVAHRNSRRLQLDAKEAAPEAAC